MMRPFLRLSWRTLQRASIGLGAMPTVGTLLLGELEVLPLATAGSCISFSKGLLELNAS